MSTRAGKARPRNGIPMRRCRAPVGRVEISRARPNAEIAAALLLCEVTVKARVSGLLPRLDLKNGVQIAMLGHEAGLR